MNYVQNNVRVGQTVRCWRSNHGETSGDIGVVRQVDGDWLTVDWKTEGCLET